MIEHVRDLPVGRDATGRDASHQGINLSKEFDIGLSYDLASG